VAGYGRSYFEMAEVRAQRGPLSDPRNGRLQEGIRFAFWSVEGLGPNHLRLKGTPDKVTTRYLMQWCYPLEHLRGELKSWHRTNVIKAARMVAIPTRGSGKGSGKGHGFVWVPINEEVLTERSWQGKSRRRRKRQGLPPIEE
jgi:hypothetical protein